jgi:hypothetical protein
VLDLNGKVQRGLLKSASCTRLADANSPVASQIAAAARLFSFTSLSLSAISLSTVGSRTVVSLRLVSLLGRPGSADAIGRYHRFGPQRLPSTTTPRAISMATSGEVTVRRFRRQGSEESEKFSAMEKCQWYSRDSNRAGSAIANEVRDLTTPSLPPDPGCLSIVLIPLLRTEHTHKLWPICIPLVVPLVWSRPHQRLGVISSSSCRHVTSRGHAVLRQPRLIVGWYLQVGPRNTVSEITVPVRLRSCKLYLVSRRRHTDDR